MSDEVIDQIEGADMNAQEDLKDPALPWFARRLRELLDARKGMSERELARKAALSPTYVNHLLNGKYDNPSLEVLTKLAGALGVMPSKLLQRPRGDDA